MQEGFRMEKKGFLIAVLLAAILLLGAFLRLHELSEESIWVDEAFTYHYVNLNWDDMVNILKTNDVHPPLFYLFGSWWNGLLGSSEFFLRLLPAIFGTLSIAVLFLLARKLYGAKVALLSALFFSLSYTMVLYSQDAKMYSMLIFFFLLSLLFLLRFAEKPTLLNSLAFVLSGALMIYTQVLGLVIIFAEMIAYYFLSYIQLKHNCDLLNALFKRIKSKFNPRRFSYAVLGLFLLYLPWLPNTFAQFQFLFLGTLRRKFLLKFGFDGFLWVFAAAIIISLIILIVMALIARKKEVVLKLEHFFSRMNIPAGLFVVLFISFLGFNLFCHQHYFATITYVRYSIFLFLLMHLFLAKNLFALPRKAFILLLILFLVVSSLILFDYYKVDSKEQWREAAQYITEDARGNDIILFHRAGHTWWAFNYYYRGNLQQEKIETVEDFDAALDKIESRDNAYLVLSHNYQTKNYFKEEMDEKFKLLDFREFIGIKIYKYEINTIN